MNITTVTAYVSLKLNMTAYGTYDSSLSVSAQLEENEDPKAAGRELITLCRTALVAEAAPIALRQRQNVELATHDKEKAAQIAAMLKDMPAYAQLTSIHPSKEWPALMLEQEDPEAIQQELSKMAKARYTVEEK